MCVCVYGEFCVLSGPICVCEDCQRLYEMCTLSCIPAWSACVLICSIPYPVQLHYFVTFYHLTPRFLCFGSSFLGTEPLPRHGCTA